ncbi:MAG TPA: maleylpyruvate isomerase family mycothiol-dependent enzyme [Acidimicrobiia bacterium]|jgi:uncharacterized protein (TIGR03083 family)
MSQIAPQLAGPWPDGVALTRREVDAYLADVGSGALDGQPSACEGWTVRDVTAHLAATFTRFDAMLQRGRTGDFAPPFAADELDVENQRAVRDFGGDPARVLGDSATSFLDAVDDPDEPIPHQLGTLPAALQVMFGLMDTAMHHDDVLLSTGRRYRPSDDAVAAMAVAAERLFQLSASTDDPWPLLVAGSGRRALPRT